MDQTLQAARAAVNAETFGTTAWESAMQVVRNMVASDQTPAEQFCSVDSGFHPYRMRSGRVIGQQVAA